MFRIQNKGKIKVSDGAPDGTTEKNIRLKIDDNCLQEISFRQQVRTACQLLPTDLR